jgi:hypothetical protein
VNRHVPDRNGRGAATRLAFDRLPDRFSNRLFAWRWGRNRSKEICLSKIAGLTGLIALVLIAPSATAAETRCGWIENTMPSSLTLTDREGSWDLAAIDWQTDGFDHVPSTNLGDTCGCITGVADKQSRRITKVLGGKLLPVATCQRDKSLK